MSHNTPPVNIAKGSSGYGNQQMAQPAPTYPEQFVIECNRSEATRTDETTKNKWTNEFSSAISIREGDAISISSAYLSSIGVGDLINFTTEEGDTEQDNKATWIYSYYVCNDGKNNKNESYNFASAQNPNNWKYDTDNRPAMLHRIMRTKEGGTRANTTETFSWKRDAVLPYRIFGDTITVKPHRIYTSQQEIGFLLVRDVSPDGTTERLKLFLYDYQNNAVVNATTIFGLGQTYQIQPVNRGTGAYNAEFGFMFSVFSFTTTTQQYTGTKTIPVGSVGIHIENIPLLFNINANDQVFNGTQCDFLGFNLNLASKTDNNNNELQHLATFTTDFDTTVNVGDTMYLYAYNTISSNPNLNVINKTITPVIDAQNNNLPTKMEVIQTALDKDAFAKQSIYVSNISNDENPTITFEMRPVEGTENFGTILAANDNRYTFFMRIFNKDINDYEHFTIYMKQSDFSFSGKQITIDGRTTKSIKRSTHHFYTAGAPVFTTNANLDNTKDNAIYYGGKFGQDVVLKFSDTNNTSDTDQNKSHQYISFSQPQTNRPAEFVKNYYCLLKTPTGTETMRLRRSQNDAQNYNTSGKFCITYGASPTNSRQYYTDSVLMLGTSIGALNGNDCLNDANVLVSKQVYNSFEYKIENAWNSPSDIATRLTEQTHLPTAPIDPTTGIVYENKKNMGIIQNKFLIPVWSSDTDDNTPKLIGHTPASEIGTIGQEVEGSYHCVGKIAALAEILNETIPAPNPNTSPATDPLRFNYIDTGLVPTGGQNYFLYFRTRLTPINKPDFNHPNNSFDFSNYFDNSGNPVGNETAICKNLKDDTIGYPINYTGGAVPNSKISQYAGAPNITWGWDDTQSRFTCGYLHQPANSVFTQNEDGSTTGGISSVVLYVPNYFYKSPQTRAGGVNIEHWYGINPDNIKNLSPEMIRQTYNIPNFDANGNAITLEDWFLNVNYMNDPVGLKFWEKLGYTKTQLDTARGQETINDPVDTTNNGCFNLLGTTEDKIDSTFSIVGAQIPAANAVKPRESHQFKPIGGTAPSNKIYAGYEYSSIGALSQNNHAVGMGGINNTAGLPNVYFAPASNPDILNVNYNPDRNISTGYTIQSQSSELIVADTLPTKTKNSYFLVMSDLISPNFYSSFNKGTHAPIIGTISKLNSDNDFYFSYASPIIYYARKDMLVNSITTEIRDANFKTPPTLSDFSSVIYQVTRNNTQPLPNPPPLFQKQEIYFKYLQQLAKQEQIASRFRMGKADRLNQIMADVAQAVLEPNEAPTDDDIADEIIRGYNDLGLERLAGNREAIRQVLTDNPDAEGFIDAVNRFTSGSGEILDSDLPVEQEVAPPSLTSGIAQNTQVEDFFDEVLANVPAPTERRTTPFVGQTPVAGYIQTLEGALQPIARTPRYSEATTLEFAQLQRDREELLRRPNTGSSHPDVLRVDRNLQRVQQAREREIREERRDRNA